MKNNMFKLTSLLFLAVLFATVISCSKDDQVTFTMTSLTAGDINLNLGTPVTGVPINPDIIAGFSVNVDATSVTATSVTLVSNYNSQSVELELVTQGNSITVSPASVLGYGSVYTLTFTGIKSTDGQSLPTTTRTFTTEGAFAPDGAIAYWNFNNTADDATGTYNPIAGGVIDISYVASFTEAAGSAASFNGTTSLIRIPNGDQLDNCNDFSLAFWVKADPTKPGLFVMGLAGWYGFQFEINQGSDDNKGMCKLAAQYRYADNSSGSEDLWFNGNGSTGQNGGWQGWTFCKDLWTAGTNVNAYLSDKWAFIACVYDATSKVGTMYINGEKMKAQDFNLWPEGDPKTTVTGLKYNGAAGNNTFVFGFIQDYENATIADSWAAYSDPNNNHFKGLLDDVRFYHKALSVTEVEMMYNSAKP